jgi:hypothetical protein
MKDMKNSSLRPVHSPLVSDILVTLPIGIFSELTLFANLIFDLAQDVLKAYNMGNPEVSHFVEFGLPNELLYLLSERQVLHKILLRYDFFLTADGPKLIEISSNPWGLITSYHAAKKLANLGVETIPAYELYLNLCNIIKPQVVGVWKNFGFIEEIDDLINIMGTNGINSKRLDEKNPYVLQELDAILFDIDTTYFNQELSLLTKYADKLLPPIGNEIIKRKNFLALVYAFATDTLKIESRLSDFDKLFIQKFLVPTYLIPDPRGALLDNKLIYGVIKDVVGLWSRQVTILSPELFNKTGSHARKARQEFRKHMKKAIEQKNAIFQEYIAFMPLEEHDDLHVEISVISNYDKYYPFARIWETSIDDKPSKPKIGLVKIL